MISWIASLQDSCDETSNSMGRRSTECSVAYLSISLTCGALRPLVSRILAYTMCPALASARAVNAPKPLDAPVQEEFGPDRPWRYNVYGNIATDQLVCQDVHKACDSGLRGNVGTIGREILRQHAARKRNNPAAIWLCAARRAPTPGRLRAG